MNKSVIKKILIVAILFLPLCGFVVAQTPTNKTSSESAIVSDMKVKAEVWFKQVYVETVFKDPYSYRLMGIKALPITLKQGLENQLSSVLDNIKKCTIHPSERNQKGHDAYITMYEKNAALAKKEQEYIDNGVDAEYHTKKKAIYVKYAELGAERAKSIALYLLDVSEKERIEGAINNLTEEQSNTIGYYDIRLDCYSKNSFGNEVLGRFSFPFTEKGPLYGDDTVKHIVNLND